MLLYTVHVDAKIDRSDQGFDVADLGREDGPTHAAARRPPCQGGPGRTRGGRTFGGKLREEKEDVLGVAAGQQGSGHGGTASFGVR